MRELIRLRETRSDRSFMVRRYFQHLPIGRQTSFVNPSLSRRLQYASRYQQGLGISMAVRQIHRASPGDERRGVADPVTIVGAITILASGKVLV